MIVSKRGFAPGASVLGEMMVLAGVTF